MSLSGQARGKNRRQTDHTQRGAPLVRLDRRLLRGLRIRNGSRPPIPYGEGLGSGEARPRALIRCGLPSEQSSVKDRRRGEIGPTTTPTTLFVAHRRTLAPPHLRPLSHSGSVLSRAVPLRSTFRFAPPLTGLPRRAARSSQGGLGTGVGDKQTYVLLYSLSKLAPRHTTRHSDTPRNEIWNMSNAVIPLYLGGPGLVAEVGPPQSERA